MAMGYGEEKSKELSEKFMERAKMKFEEFDAPGLTAEDVAAVFCYTYECNRKENERGFESPYRKLNNSLSVDRSSASLKKTCAFLFLLLSALRRLPRYTPVKGVLYRGIRKHVQTEVTRKTSRDSLRKEKRQGVVDVHLHDRGPQCHKGLH